ncbi:ATP-binding protein [candidate division CSSED10-310 bacterium]|uniref:histidine kinase n=1 Tax=candidate division CSSED10-310 bacterium TaxID=2855610 RepID=A0ABV6YVB1_UNCC1
MVTSPEADVIFRIENFPYSVEIRIADSGPGVPIHLRKKIFEPYHTTKEGGTGIGLSISQRIIGSRYV